MKNAFIAPIIDRDLQTLYSVAMGSLIDQYAANKKFFTQKEFEHNQAKIFAVTNAYNKFKDKITHPLMVIPNDPK